MSSEQPLPSSASATALAHAVVDVLLRAGVNHVVLAPGSRNAPLSFALARRARHGELTLHTRIDERTAAFVALGAAKASHRPAAVVTTSGTAAANLYPAMLEAGHAGVALIAVTADRPAELRGTGASQTTDQVGLLSPTVTYDLATLADLGRLKSVIWSEAPVHLNVQFREPLTPTGSLPLGSIEAMQAMPAAELSTLEISTLEILSGPRTVVVAGDDSGSAGRRIAEEGGWPLFAEPTSGSRSGECALRTYRLLLQSSLADDIERVIVTGHPTLSRPVARLLARSDIEVVSRRAHGWWPQRPFAVTAEADEIAVLAGEPDAAWLERWRKADDEMAGRVDQFIGSLPGLTPYAVAAEVAALPLDGLLWVGASNPIRDLDLMSQPNPGDDRRTVMANRGLAGIDGTISSAIGAAITCPNERALLYVGDVTLVHDLTALVVGPGELRPDLTIVVANDNGGSIFATLEQGAPEYADDFDKLFATPHHVDLAAICAAVQVPHWRVESRNELAHALANPNGGIEVIEARISRSDRREWEERLRTLR